MSESNSPQDPIQTLEPEGIPLTVSRRTSDGPQPGGVSPSRKKAFTVLFLIEMWERFGYYGMAVLLVLFMKEHLGFTDSRANLTWGAFAAMVYATPTLGGWVGDKLLGARRTTVLGAVVLMLGYVMLALPGATPLLSSNGYLFFSLGMVAAGNGLFKANPNNLLSRLYEGDESGLDSAFTVYYMAINIGALGSQILTPIIRVHFGWYWAFAACAVGLAFGIAQFVYMRRNMSHVGSEPDFKPLNIGKLIAVIVGTVAIGALIALVVQSLSVAQVVVDVALVALLVLFGILLYKANSNERNGLIAMYVLCAQVILFFVFYQQMSTSLTFFALRNVNLNFFGYHVPPEQFQVLNPFWIALASPLLAVYYTKKGAQGKDLSIGAKYAIGFVLLALGFFVYGISRYFAVAGKVSPWFMVAGYGLQSVSELLISGLGLAVVARYVRPSLRGLMMGAWLLATGLSQYIGSFVANFASVPKDVTDPLKTLPIYTHLFNVLGIVAVGGAVIAIAMIPWMRRLDARSKMGDSPA